MAEVPLQILLAATVNRRYKFNLSLILRFSNADRYPCRLSFNRNDVSLGYVGGNMKKLSRLFAAACVLVSAASVWPQSQLLTNLADLAQFPSIERIKAGMKGTDDVDSHARFIAALYRINDMIAQELVRAPNGGMYPIPQSAQPVQNRYSNAITHFTIDAVPPAGRDPRYRPLEAKYEKDPAFFDNLLTQFFSPKFRADYYAWIRKPVPQQTAGTGGASKASSPDRSIVKAKAFKMDTTVFGMELGKPFTIPANTGSGIPLFDTFFPPVPTQQRNSDPLTQRELITLDADRCPSWVFLGCQVYVVLYEGQLVAVEAPTKGRKVENSVKAELRAKYGPPTLISNVKITSNLGSSFEVDEPLWMGRGIRVEYQVVVHNEDVGVDITSGLVRIITETAYDRLYNKPVKRKL